LIEGYLAMDAHALLLSASPSTSSLSVAMPSAFFSNYKAHWTPVPQTPRRSGSTEVNVGEKEGVHHQVVEAVYTISTTS
jgi:hypothetical protein